MRIVSETDRLALAELREVDAPFILRLLNSPDWLRHIGDRNVRTIEDARRYITQGAMASYRERGYGGWVILRKSDAQPIGLCGLFTRDFLNVPDLGFALVPEAMGFGYASEAAEAVVKLGRESFGLKSLAAITSPDNLRSVRLLEKLGFRFQGERKAEGAVLHYYLVEWHHAGLWKDDDSLEQ